LEVQSEAVDNFGSPSGFLLPGEKGADAGAAKVVLNLL
jgi:hypothetical protein